MKNKGGIIALLIAFVLLSLYYLVRTWKVNDIRKDAAAYATGKDGKIDPSKKQRYLDSLWKQPVFLGSTLENLSKQELGLGLDLQGGMHVILEVSPTGVVKALANASRDPRVTQALANADKAAVTSSKHYSELFAQEFKKLAPDTKLATIFVNTSNRDILNIQSSDSEVLRYVKEEIDGAFDRSSRPVLINLVWLTLTFQRFRVQTVFR